MNVRMEKTLLPDRNTLCLSGMIYEGYSGPVVLRNVPDGVKDIIQEDAEKYGTIIE